MDIAMHRRRPAVIMLLLLAALVFASPSAKAYYSATLLSQDFSGSTFVPSGWYDASYGAWMRSSNGRGGSNGSAVVDMWDYYYGYDDLQTPAMDASAFQVSNDTV